MTAASPADPLRVLILCTGNSARSQMAEGLLRHLSEGRMQVASAGTQPTAVKADAVEVMRELGLDISHARSKHVDELAGQAIDYVITVCDHARETCPVFPASVRRIHWSFDDPAAATGSADERRAVFRRVRDELAERLRGFVEEHRDARG